jgi:hypothetical protein
MRARQCTAPSGIGGITNGANSTAAREPLHTQLRSLIGVGIGIGIALRSAENTAWKTIDSDADTDSDSDACRAAA